MIHSLFIILIHYFGIRFSITMNAVRNVRKCHNVPKNVPLQRIVAMKKMKRNQIYPIGCNKMTRMVLYCKSWNYKQVRVLYNINTGFVSISSRYQNRDRRLNMGKSRQKIIDNIKKEASCALCGYSEYTEALDFHHVNPKDKKYCIDANHMHRKDFIEEMQKCIVLCKCCHAHITRLERGNIK